MALIPKFCGEPGTMIPEDACGSITFEGIDDVTINQGAGIDLLEGVKAYDKNGVEIPVIAEPSEIPKCEVGEHTVEYKAIGEADKFAPHIFCGDNKIKAADCQISIETEDRVITIEQADPPTINGIDELDLDVGDTVDLMDGVSGVDDNGNPAEVEYLGGVMSDVAEDDDIATFDTDIEAPLKSLQLTLSPHQDCTPWIGTEENTTPYLFRAMPTQANDYNRESLNQIVGGTVAWNQLCITPYSNTAAGITFTRDSDRKSITISGTATQTIYKPMGDMEKTVIGHVYYVDRDTSNTDIWIYNDNKGVESKTDAKAIGKATGEATFYIRVENGATVNETITPQIIDLTAMFGSTIADYIYTLEQANAGAGVAWLKSYGFLTKDYYEYTQPTLESVRVSGHVMRDADDNIIGDYPLDPSVTLRGILKLDANNEIYADGDVHPPSGGVSRRYGELTLNGTENWAYDGSVASNTYKPFYISLDSMKRELDYTGEMFNDKGYPVAINHDFRTLSDIGKYVISAYGASLTVNVGRNWLYIAVNVSEGITTAEQLKTWLAQNPLTIVYELATTTTETADPYTQIQFCDPDGTESFTDYGVASGDRDVAIPVGHDSTYSLVCPISGYDSVSATRTGKNLLNPDCDVFNGYFSSGGNIYSNASNRIAVLPCEPNTTYTFTYNRVAISGSDDFSVWFFDNYPTSGDVGTRTNHYQSGNVETDTSTENSRYIAIKIANITKTDYAETVNASQLELGSTATEYEPYQGQTYTADLPQTVYGGTVDLVSGEMVVDRAMVTYSSVYSVAQGTSAPLYYWMFATNPKAPTNNEADLISDQYVLGGFAIGKCYITNTGQLIVAVPADQTLNTKELADAWLEQNPVQFCYKLSTPQTYQLTPQEIQTLVGTNNVWSDDADHVEVIFLKSIPQDNAQFNVDGVYAVDYIATDECGNQTVKTRLIYVGDAECEPLEDENGNPLQTEIGEILCYEEGLPCAVTCESAVCECVVCCD